MNLGACEFAMPSATLCSDPFGDVLSSTDANPQKASDLESQGDTANSGCFDTQVFDRLWRKSGVDS